MTQEKTIHLYQPPPAWGLPSLSPFCAKLETYLKMAGHPYVAKTPNLLKAPKKKIPYVGFDDGTLLGDSGLIIDHLRKTRGDRLDAKLTAEQKAVGHAARRMLEESTYFGIAWLRWMRDGSFAHVADFFVETVLPVPKPLGRMLVRKIRRDFGKTMRAQGIGRHSETEITALVSEDLKALSVLLGDKPYLLGDEPTSFDATVYGFLINVVHVPWDAPDKAYARSLPNLVAYCERIKKRYFAA